MAPDNTLPHFLKLGKLHSTSNLKLRAQYFEEKYGECMKGEEIPDRDDEDSAIKSSEYYQRYPWKGFKGFNFQNSCLKLFYMAQDMIEELEMHEQFTSDEESTNDDEAELHPISLPLCFDFERGLTFQGKIIQNMSEDGDDDSLSDEGDSVSHRPISRLSLEVDEKFDESGSEYDSDYFFCESEGEDNHKKVIYGPVAGVPVGTVWRTRRLCSSSKVHIPCKSRIHAGVKAGCSIVLSSQEMIDDEGVLFTYKSKAKLDNFSSTMTHQLIGGNKALQNNFLKRTPIRVIRSYQLRNPFAPKKGYRYDGLYDVKIITVGRIKNGYQYCKANLVRCPNQPPPPWATNNSPAGDVPGHLLSTTEIDYNTGDESTSSGNRESPLPLHPAAEHLLISRSKSKPIVLLRKLSVAEIEKATNMVSAPVRKSHLWQQVHHKENKNSKKESKKLGESKEIVSKKHSRSSQASKNNKAKQSNAELNRTTVEKKNNLTLLARETNSAKRKRLSMSSEEHNKEGIESISVFKANINSSKNNDTNKNIQKHLVLKQKTKEPLKTASKTVQGSGTKSDFMNEKGSNQFRKNVSKNHDIQSKGARKSANSSSLKQNVSTPKGKLLDEKKITPGPKTAGKHSSAKRSLPENKQRNNMENKLEKVVSHNKKQKLAQTEAGIVLRRRGRKEL